MGPAQEQERVKDLNYGVFLFKLTVLSLLIKKIDVLP